MSVSLPDPDAGMELTPAQVAALLPAVQRGEIEMGTFIRVEDADGKVRLVKRDATRMKAGDVKAFMPGDIHDTRCIKGPVTLLRLTDRDLLREEHETDRLTRYVEIDGVWTVKPRD